MPNWCDNSLQLTAATKREADELHNFLKTYNDSDTPEGEVEKTLFGFFLPEPNYDSPDDEQTAPDWYWWRVNNWGTKWDAGMHSWDWIDDYTCVLQFATAWSPPIGIYEAMMEQGWDVSATYHEPGMAFVGAWVNGDDEYYDYAACNSSNVRDVVGEDLDDEYGISEMMAQWEQDDEFESDIQETKSDSETAGSSEETENEGFGQEAYQGGVEHWGAKQ